ncbi:hypothetical protein G6R29_04595 [Fructobacillus sp. M2-14]|uniref:Uncharacterized protein n=1 Tax=Fructobacillus broussonetiae TaxID=2713173 RepID=A0ABS5R0C8_9LACO|nr:hypothetical protein [Fructobacillus broussonetiae]MBS9338903.1 hypothetical protein [Fructobacillus broussonetiae]
MFELISGIALRGGARGGGLGGRGGGRVTPRSTRRSSRPRRSSGSDWNIGRMISRGIFYYFGWRIGQGIANALGFFGIVLIIILAIAWSRRRRR